VETVRDLQAEAAGPPRKGPAFIEVALAAHDRDGGVAAALARGGLAFGVLVIAYATFMLPPSTPSPWGS
jgi:hypothetical protein